MNDTSLDSYACLRHSLMAQHMPLMVCVAMQAYMFSVAGKIGHGHIMQVREVLVLG